MQHILVTWNWKIGDLVGDFTKQIDEKNGRHA